MSPAPYRQPVGIPRMPGEKVDPAILTDVEWIVSNFKVKVTDGYSTSDVHAANGEHPLGLAIDFVPDASRGGTWDDIARLIRWAEPQQNRPRPPFRWVGYNGDSGHGDPQHAGGNAHAHLSWNHDSRGRVSTIFGPDGKPNRGITLPTGASGSVSAGTKTSGPQVPSSAELAAAAIPGVGAVAGPLASAADNVGVLGDVTSAGGDITAGIAKALVSGIVDAIGADGARILLYAGLAIGGTVLAVLGIAKAAGVKAPTDAAGLAALVATRNPKAAAAVSAAGGAK